MKSDLSGFYELSIEQRLALLKQQCNLTTEEVEVLHQTGCLHPHTADMMIENVVGTVELPVGVATNFKINGKDVLVPMAIEEPSVVAAASHAAKLARPQGFASSADEPLMIGQIQLMGASHDAKSLIMSARSQLTEIANSKDSTLIKLGGGLRDIEVHEYPSSRGKITVVHLIVNVQDAMGANAVNTMCESVAPFLEELTGARSVLKIISNLAVYRLARAKVTWPKSIGEDVIEGILDAYAFAAADKYRCATHNKGIMNGIDAVMIATGNDFRAAEAGAHAFAARNNNYVPLTHYEKDAHGNLVGTIEMPIAAGIVGGATKTNPVARVAIKIMGAHKASDLAQVAVCVGLANNFAAMRAMVKEGIQAGHMRLHASNIAHSAGASHTEIPAVVRRMLAEKKITMAYASEVLAEMRG
ncbi:MAG TPA: hydroxymethylglutaryl-CoA reductase, degradative [archaeon]|nr:hydroxymethylglutaryl-CoA reductase, degradative [archaeon]